MSIVAAVAQLASATATIATAVAQASGGASARRDAIRISPPELVPAALLDVSRPRGTGPTIYGTATKPAAAAAPADERPRASASAGGSMRGITPDQHTDGKTLSKAEASSACGPAAAVAFARFLGKGTTLDDAAKVARSVGWSTAGMKGPDSQVALLDKLGVKAKKEPIDWERVKKTVLEGKPVIIDTPQHYWVVEGYDAATGKFEFGKSGSALAQAKGKTQFTPAEVDKMSGAARNAIYLT